MSMSLYASQDDPCPRYKPIKKGQKLRLFANKAKAYVATSQSALSPLSGDDEEYGVFTVPAPTSDGKKTDMETMQSLETPDVVWQVSWPGDEEEWHPKTQVRMLLQPCPNWSVLLNAYLTVLPPGPQKLPSTYTTPPALACTQVTLPT